MSQPLPDPQESGKRQERQERQEPAAESVPCGFMRELLSSLADGTLTGLLRWFAEQHARGCSRCGPALAGLLALRERLRGLKALPATEAGLSLSPERRAALEAAWQKLDREESAGERA